MDESDQSADAMYRCKEGCGRSFDTMAPMTFVPNYFEDGSGKFMCGPCARDLSNTPDWAYDERYDCEDVEP